jgi:hypothetical protein
MKLRHWEFGLVVSLCLCASGSAQVPIQPVQWTGAVVSKTPIKAGASIVIQLSAKVEDRWHVYGLAQSPGGPTPLRVTVDPNEIVQVTGATSGTAPIKKHDTAFDLDTEVYEGSFALRLPAQINQHPAASATSIPVSIRFQACNDRVCLPPRTVHVSVPIEIFQGN